MTIPDRRQPAAQERSATEQAREYANEIMPLDFGGAYTSYNGRDVRVAIVDAFLAGFEAGARSNHPEVAECVREAQGLVGRLGERSGDK